MDDEKVGEVEEAKPEQPEAPPAEENMEAENENENVPEKKPEKKKKKEKRLYISKITCENFKSYFGAKEIGPFHKCYSAVVGPNGSGKSNVIDAIIFVFGKRANKLRLKKLSELIHRSDEHPDCKFAKVTLHLCEIRDKEGDEFDVVRGSRFTVSRAVSKSSQSTYRLNGERVKYDIIRELLLDKGVDLTHERYLILQGEVEKISLMKPKGETPGEVGLLEYLEEIIGTDKYIPKITNMGRIDEQLAEKCYRSLARLKHAETSRDELEGAKKEAEKVIEMIVQQLILQNLLQQIKIFDLEQENDNIATRCENAFKKHEELRELKKSAQEEEKAAKTRMVLQQGKVGELEEKTKKLKAKFDEIDTNDRTLGEEIKQIKKQGKKRIKDLKKVQDDHKFGEKLVEDAKAVIPKLEEDKAQYTQKLKELEEEHEKIKEEIQRKTAPIREELNKKQTELVPLKDAFTKSDAKCKEIENEIGAITNKIAKAQDTYRECQNNIQKLRKETKDIKERGKMYAQDMAQHNGAAQQLKVELAKKGQEIDQLRKQFEKQTDLHKRKKYLFNDQSRQDTIVTELLRAQKAGKLTGVHGRLGDLGCIDARYDVAASMAGGRMLQRILVETTRDGQKCIEYLKKNQLGRGQFLVLEKARKFEKYLERINTPENVPRVLDLVECENKIYKTAFAQTFRNTLVCEDMDQAARVGYGEVDNQRWRCVTLKGRLVEMSGSMTGGGRPQRGLLRIKNRRRGVAALSQDFVEKADLDKLQTEIDKLNEELKLMKAEYRVIERNIKSECEQEERAVAECMKIDAEYKAKKAREKQAKENLPRLKAEAENIKREEEQIKKLKVTYSRFMADRHEKEKVCKRVEQDCTVLQNKIQQSGGERFGEVKDEIQQDTKVLEEIENNLQEHKINLTTGEGKLKSAGPRIEEIQKDLKALAEKRDGLIKEKQKLEEECKPVLEEHKKLEAMLKQSELDLVELKKTFEEKTRSVKELSKKVRKLGSEIKSLKNRSEANIAILIEWKKKSDHEIKKIHSKQNMFGLELYKPPIRNQEDMDTHIGNKPEYENKIAALGKLIDSANVNYTAIREWQVKQDEYFKLMDQWKKDEKKRTENNHKLMTLKDKRMNEFLTGFTKITQKLKEMYQILTFGGDADLELIDSHDPFSEGVRFTVRPPKKSWKDIHNLSGGEKTLSSLSLVFSLHHYQPAALYVMDEIDAALDFKNVSIVANYIKRETKNAQFIIISLRNQMFELANRMIGIYKTTNVTKSMTYNPNVMEEKMKSILERRRKILRQKREQSQRNEQSNQQKENAV